MERTYESVFLDKAGVVLNIFFLNKAFIIISLLLHGTRYKKYSEEVYSVLPV